jgi:hypothetical protein
VWIVQNKLFVGDSMKRLIIFAALFAILLTTFLNYPDIVAFIISRIQYKEAVTVFYEEIIEPKDRIADISITALSSMVTSKLGERQYRFIALDANKMGNFSDREVQYLLTYFKAYSDKVICASLKDLVRIGLCTPRIKDLRGGVLLSIDDVIEMTNERVILKVTHYQSGMGAESYLCTLSYKNSKWRVDALDLKYIA